MWYKQMLHINDIYFGNQQREGENIVQFVTRLHQVSEGNNYGAELENQIRDQIVQSCKLNDLRHKLMAKGDMLTFGETLKIACSFEVLETQIQTMRLDGGSKVNKITFTGIRKGLGHGKGHSKLKMTVSVLDVGILEILPRIHVALSGVKQAEDVGKKKHFKKKCRPTDKPKRDDGKTNTFGGRRGREMDAMKIYADDECSSSFKCNETRMDAGYAFAINNKHATVPVRIGGV